MIKLFLTVFVALLFINKPLLAQELKPAAGSVQVVQDEDITRLNEQYAKMSKNNPDVEGYRVQIYFDSGSNSKSKASSIKSEFETTYPGTRSYLSYKEPYYRVRVGDFRTLTEAVGFQQKIAADYPNSFPVKDKIVQ